MQDANLHVERVPEHLHHRVVSVCEIGSVAQVCGGEGRRRAELRHLWSFRGMGSPCWSEGSPTCGDAQLKPEGSCLGDWSRCGGQEDLDLDWQKVTGIVDAASMEAAQERAEGGDRG